MLLFLRIVPPGSRQRSIYCIHFEASVWMSGRESGTKGRSNAHSRAMIVVRRRASELQTEAGGRKASSIAAAVTSANGMQRIDHGRKGTGPASGRIAKWSERWSRRCRSITSATRYVSTWKTICAIESVCSNGGIGDDCCCATGTHHRTAVLLMSGAPQEENRSNSILQI